MVAYPKSRQEPQLRLTPQEYLERERKAETKSEYYGGMIVAMAGASPEHNTITSNIHGELYGQLRAKNCRPFVSDLRLSAPQCHKYFYPDVIVVCGEPRYETLVGIQSLLNPTLVIEVLSDSTETADRGEKWMCYQTLDSLQTYILISQDRPLVEVYHRQEKGWFYSSAQDMESVVSLEAIGCELRLADVYARIAFQKPSGEQADSEPTTASA